MHFADKMSDEHKADQVVSEHDNDSFNDVKSFITNQMGSILRMARSERSLFPNVSHPVAPQRLTVF